MPQLGLQRAGYRSIATVHILLPLTEGFMQKDEMELSADKGCDAAFTLCEYEALLRRTSQLYPFVGFDVLGDAPLPDRRFCLLRHDIDLSPARALQIAEIEARLNIRATYTVLMTGRFYNVFEPEVREMLRAIARLGHAIGLHFDTVWHGIEDEAALDEALAWEAGILQRLLGVPIDMFSFHDPHEFAHSCRADKYAGLWNAYSERLRQNVRYLSDSNGYWRFQSWSETLAEDAQRLHILTHPDWWVERAETPAERVCSLIEGRARATWDAYSDNLAIYGRTNDTGVPTAAVTLPRSLGSRGNDIVRRWLSGDRVDALLSLLNLLAQSESALPERLIRVRKQLETGEIPPPIQLRDAFEEAAAAFGCAR